jgi:hypothetical protein
VIVDAMMLLRGGAAIATVVAAILVASNVGPRAMVAGFVIFVGASLAWMADGWIEGKASLVVQNAILLLVNLAGIWRWAPRAAKA